MDLTLLKMQQRIEANTQILSLNLQNAILSPLLSYDQICLANTAGLYLIFDESDILYVGKTNRTGKIRIKELTSDFRSHTFNKKMLSKRFKDLGFVFKVLKNETKQKWINEGLLSDTEFKAHQKEVNQNMANFKFKFFQEVDERALICLEHFAIAILNPIYND